MTGAPSRLSKTDVSSFPSGPVVSSKRSSSAGAVVESPFSSEASPSSGGITGSSFSTGGTSSAGGVLKSSPPAGISSGVWAPVTSSTEESTLSSSWVSLSSMSTGATPAAAGSIESSSAAVSRIAEIRCLAVFIVVVLSSLSFPFALYTDERNVFDIYNMYMSEKASLF